MKICVVGLGLIGGSLCMALKRAGYAVDGWNRSPAPLKYAAEKGIIRGVCADFCSYDVVFIALPPETALNFIDKTRFKDGAIVSDICGVKGYILDGVNSKPRNFRYVGLHPMAGKEVSGIENACEDLFDRASMIIVSDKTTDPAALERMRSLTEEMGFARMVECSAEVHDEKIAYTSQLAHVVSNAYVKDAQLEGCMGFTGGSFQDMTRIAGVDENVWASLYLKNARRLSDRIQQLIDSLGEIKEAIDSGDGENLRSVLKTGRLRYCDEEKNIPPDGVFVKKLK